MQYSSFNPDAAADNDLQVVVGVGSPALLDAGTGAKRSVSLRGHDGVALDASYANGDFLTLGWEERPHIYVVLHAQGLTADQLLTVAKAMKPVSLSEWTQAMGSVLQGADSAAGAATTAAATTEAVAVPASVPPGSSDGGVTPASIAPPSGPSFPDMAKLTQNPPPVVASGQLEGRPWALHAGTVPLTQQDNTNVTVPGKFTACAVLDFAKRPAMIVQCDTPDSGSVGTGVIRTWSITDSPRRFVLLLVDPKVATADATFDTGHVVTAAATTIDRAGPTDSKALVIPILPTDRLKKVVFKDGAGTVIETLTVDVPGDPEQR